MNIKITISILLALVFLFGCARKPESIKKAGNFDVEFLFECDGVKVYRFSDLGKYIYFTKCVCDSNSISSYICASE